MHIRSGRRASDVPFFADLAGPAESSLSGLVLGGCNQQPGQPEDGSQGSLKLNTLPSAVPPLPLPTPSGTSGTLAGKRGGLSAGRALPALQPRGQQRKIAGCTMFACTETGNPAQQPGDRSNHVGAPFLACSPTPCPAVPPFGSACLSPQSGRPVTGASPAEARQATTQHSQG